MMKKMALSKSKVIVSISDKKVIGTQVSVKRGKFVMGERVMEERIPGVGLDKIFTLIAKQLKAKSIRVLLADKLVYLKLLELPFEEGITRALVLEKAQESIPEVLEDGYFDWKQVEADKKTIKVQVVAANKEKLKEIQLAAKTAKLEIKAFESVSFALARLTASEKEPHIIIFKEEEAVIAATHKGQVFEAITVADEAQIEKKTKELKKFVENVWQVKVEKVIQEGLNPFIGLAMKEDLKGQDEKVLNLTPPTIEAKVENKMPASKKEEKKPQEKEEDSVQKEEEDKAPAPKLEVVEPKAVEPKKEEVVAPSSEEASSSEKEEAVPPPTPTPPVTEIAVDNSQSEKKPYLLFGLIAFLVVVLIGGGIFVYQKALNKDKAEETVGITPTPIVTEVPTATPTELPLREELLVQILNGSGTAGKASEAKNLLEDLGYENIEAGNADSYDYEETEISIKESKENFLNMLSDDLSEEYTLAPGHNILDEEKEFDAVVIIGKE